MIILKESIENVKIKILPSGTAIGSEDEIKNWSLGTSLPGIFYHYSPKRDKILRDGFRLSGYTGGDGIYFAYDDRISRGFGDGSSPIKVMIKVDREHLLSGKYTDRQKQIIAECEEEEPDIVKQMDNGEPGGLGKFMSYCGFLVMDDGIQIIVSKPSCIGIILE